MLLETYACVSWSLKIEWTKIENMLQFSVNTLFDDSYVAHRGNSVLTKRSTHVDQNFKSSKGMSQLSVAIFIAPRTHFWAQKSLFLSKKSEKRTNINIPYVDSAQRCSLKDWVQTYFDPLMGNDGFEWMHSHVKKWKIEMIFGRILLQQVF